MLHNHPPKISIVTPSYNQGHLLEDTILSVLDQGYPNLEYIVVDGGSEDNSLEVIKKYEEFLCHWVSEPDDGQYHAINKGFTFATGDIFAWINSSDIYLPWSFKTVSSVFSELKSVDWLTTLNKLVFDEKGHCIKHNSLPAVSSQAFMDGCYLPIWPQSIGWIQQESTFWRKSLWDRVGGLRLDCGLAADFDLWGRFFDHAELFGLKAPLAGHRFHSDQLSRQDMKYRMDAEEALSRLRLAKKLPPLKKVMKTTSGDETIHRFINLYREVKQWPLLGNLLSAMYETCCSLRKKKYHGQLIKSVDSNGDFRWEICPVDFKV